METSSSLKEGHIATPQKKYIKKIKYTFINPNIRRSPQMQPINHGSNHKYNELKFMQK